MLKREEVKPPRSRTTSRKNRDSLRRRAKEQKWRRGQIEIPTIRAKESDIRGYAVSPVSAKEIREKIIKSIDNEKYNARTINGIAKETKLTAAEIAMAIRVDSFLKKHIKIFPRRTTEGRVLITTKNKFLEHASFRDKFVDVFSTNRLGLEDVK